VSMGELLIVTLPIELYLVFILLACNVRTEP
jgi:hypothetical protein